VSSVAAVDEYEGFGSLAVLGMHNDAIPAASSWDDGWNKLLAESYFQHVDVYPSVVISLLLSPLRDIPSSLILSPYFEQSILTEYNLGFLLALIQLPLTNSPLPFIRWFSKAHAMERKLGTALRAVLFISFVGVPNCNQTESIC